MSAENLEWLRRNVTFRRDEAGDYRGEAPRGAFLIVRPACRGGSWGYRVEYTFGGSSVGFWGTLAQAKEAALCAYDRRLARKYGKGWTA